MNARWAAVSALALLIVAPFVSAEQTTGKKRSFDVADIISFVRVVGSDGRKTFVLSPDGERAAFVTSAGHAQTGEIEYRLHVVERGGPQAGACGQEEPLSAPAFTMSAHPTATWTVLRNHRAGIEQLRWTADGSALLFLAGDQDDRRGLFRLDVAAHRVTEVLPVARNILSFDATASRLAATVFDAQQTAVNAAAAVDGIVAGPSDWLMDLLNGPRSRKFISYEVIDYTHPDRPVTVERDIARLDHDAANLWLSPDGRFAVALRVPPDFPADWNDFQIGIPGLAMEFSLLDMQAGQSRSLTGAPVALINGFQGPVRAFWLSDSKSVVLSNTFLKSRHGSYVVEIDAHTGKATPIHELPGSGSTVTVRDIELDAPSARLIIHVAEAGRERRIEYVRQPGGVWKRMTDRGQDRARAPGWISVVQSLAESPAIQIQRRAGCSEKIPLNPALAHIAIGAAQELRWTTAAGRSWKGALLLPVGFTPEHRYPLVIQTHGYDPGEFLVDGPYGWATGYAARALAAQDMAVLQIEDQNDLVGQPDEGESMSQAYLSAIQALVERGLVDRDRVGLLGFSRTAYHVKYALTHHPEAFAAAAVSEGSDNGYVQYVAWYEDPPGNEAAGVYARLYELQNAGQPYGLGLAAWASRAPGFMIDRVKAPVRVLIPKPESLLSEWEWVAGLRRRRIPIEVAYTNAGSHQIAYPAHRILFQQGNVDWFRFWLKGEEDSDPAKAQQYQRWRAMRATPTPSSPNANNISVPGSGT